MITKQAVINELAKHEEHSAWMHGVVAYAGDILNRFSDMDFGYLVYRCNRAFSREDGADRLRMDLCSPFNDWNVYSRELGLKDDKAIATRLCTPEELRRFDGGNIQPNGRTTWTDIQTRALYNAACLIVVTIQSLQGVE